MILLEATLCSNKIPKKGTEGNSNWKEKTYTGLTGNTFKDRWNQHNSDMRNVRQNLASMSGT